MTPRICFIGDSQVAALKLALSDSRWDGVRDRVTILGARGNGLMTATIRDGKLVSDDKAVQRYFRLTAGADHVDLAEHDIFCVVGCRVNFNPVNKIADVYTTYALGLPGRQLVSADLFESLLAGMFRRSNAAMVIDLLRSATANPVYLMPGPLWSPRVRELEKGRVLNEVVALGKGDAYLRTFRQSMGVAFDGIPIITQPDDTVFDSLFTDMKYSVGSVALTQSGSEHGEEDFAHMNADYGNRMLTTFFDVLGK